MSTRTMTPRRAAAITLYVTSFLETISASAGRNQWQELISAYKTRLLALGWGGGRKEHQPLFSKDESKVIKVDTRAS